MKDLKTKEKFIELRAAGVPYSRIAEELSVSKSTLVEWSKDLTTEIANLRAIEMESLLEKHLASKDQRIKLFSATLQKLVAELDRRDLADLPTYKLLDLITKYGSLLNEEWEAVQFKGTEKGSMPDMFPDVQVSWVG